MAGILAAADLEVAVAKGIVERDNAAPLVRQTTIELHAGDIAWYGLLPADSRRVESDAFEVHPGEVVSLITQERVNLPGDMSGVIFPRGRLMALGLWSSATHVDSRFTGHLRVMVANVGSNIVRIPAGEEIGRLELCRLPLKSKAPYTGVNADLRRSSNQSDYLVLSTASAREVVSGLNPREMRERISRLERTTEFLTRAARGTRLLSFYSVATTLGLLVTALVVWRWDELLELFSSPLGIPLASALFIAAATAVWAAVKKRYARRVAAWLRAELPDWDDRATE